MAREKRKRERKKEAIINENRVKNFRQQKFVVLVHTKDGRKSDFESVLIGGLLVLGATVKHLQEDKGRAANGDMLNENEILLIGVSWEDMSSWNCDYRLSNKEKILAAGNCMSELSTNDLASAIVEKIISIF